MTPRTRAALAVLCLAYFMVVLDATIVNVALPDLGRGLATGVTGLQWVVDAYTLTLAASLLSAGALADRLGGRRVFVAGVVVFTAASLACGLAPSVAVLVCARIAQGAGAALSVAASLALLRAVFSQAAARARAIGAWGAIAGIGAAAGPPLGGALVTALGWRAVFAVNVPIGAAAALLAPALLPGARGRPHARVDVAGQLASAVALGGLTLVFMEAHAKAALALGGVGAFAAGALAFAFAERRAREPMLPLRLFADRRFSGANAVGLLINLGFYGQLFVLNLYLQHVRHASPLVAGLALLPELAMATLASAVSGRAIARRGAALPMVAGLGIGAVGLAGLVGVGARTPYALLVPPLVATGFGMALTMPAATSAVIDAAPAERAGIAAGVINAARQLGGVIGVALLGSFVASGGSFEAGMRAAFALAAAAFACGGAVVLGAVWQRRSPAAA